MHLLTKVQCHGVDLIGLPCHSKSSWCVEDRQADGLKPIRQRLNVLAKAIPGITPVAREMKTDQIGTLGNQCRSIVPGVPRLHAVLQTPGLIGHIQGDWKDSNRTTTDDDAGFF